MVVQARRQRISPSGRFIQDAEGGSGPLEVGPGTQGLVLRRSGIAQDPPLAMTGVDVLVNRWRSPTDEAVAIDTLDFVLALNASYDVFIHMPMQLPAVPAGNLIVELTGRNVETSVRSNLLQEVTALPDSQFHFPFWKRDANYIPAATYDQLQVEVTAPATCVLLVDLMSILITQYQGL